MEIKEKCYSQMRAILQNSDLVLLEKMTMKCLRQLILTRTIKHPLKKMFCGCFSYKYIGSVLIEGMMNAQKYKDVLEHKLEAELRKVDVTVKQFLNKIQLHAMYRKS